MKVELIKEKCTEELIVGTIKIEGGKYYFEVGISDSVKADYLSLQIAVERGDIKVVVLFAEAYSTDNVLNSVYTNSKKWSLETTSLIWSNIREVIPNRSIKFDPVE